MSLTNLAQNQAFKESKDLTGGMDKKIFKAAAKSKLSNVAIAREVLWFFGACFIAFLSAFLVYYLIGEFLTPIFVDFVTDLGSITRFYFWIFIFNLIGVYVARLIVWAVKTVANGQ